MRIVYLDKTRDHSLEKEDKNFPVFALLMMVCDQRAYEETLVPMVNRLKFDYSDMNASSCTLATYEKLKRISGFLLTQRSAHHFTNASMTLCQCQAMTWLRQ